MKVFDFEIVYKQKIKMAGIPAKTEEDAIKQVKEELKYSLVNDCDVLDTVIKITNRKEKEFSCKALNEMTCNCEISDEYCHCLLNEECPYGEISR